MKLIFDSNGNDKQKEAYKLWADNTTTDFTYGGSKGSGKSYLGCSLIIGDALMYDGTFYFIVRKKLNDLRKFTIPSIHEVFKNWGITKNYYKYNGQDCVFEFHNGSKIFLLDAKYMPGDDPLYERFGSMQITRGWIEEGGEIDPNAKANLQASIGRWKNKEYNLTPKLLITCNPSKGFLYSDYYKPHKECRLPEYRKFIQALPEDNKMLADGYLENLDRILTKSQKQRLLHGNWEYDDNSELLVNYDAVCDCFTNTHVKQGDRHISADLAMKGRDRFVAGLWSGHRVKIAIDKVFSPANIIEQDLKQLKIDAHVGNTQIVADSDGLGAYLESYINNIKEFHGGATAIDSKTYANLKSECAYKLAELINNRDIYIECSREQENIIKDELMMLIGKDIDPSIDKKRLISKKGSGGMTQLLGHSPDYLDMLIMEMIFIISPVNKPSAPIMSY